MDKSIEMLLNLPHDIEVQMVIFHFCINIQRVL